MTFTDFMLNVPPAVRFLLAVGLTVGITLVAARVMRQRILDLADADRRATG